MPVADMRLRSAVRAAALALLALLPAASARAAAPGTPVVTVFAADAQTAVWNWTLTANTTGFRVLSSTGGGNISGDLPASATSFFVTGLSTNTSRAVTIEAFGPGGTADSALTTSFSAAATPSGSRLLGTNVDAVSLSWGVMGNPAGTVYDIYWSSAGGTPVVVATAPAVVAGSASATVPGLPGGFTINLQVLAVNGAGQKSAFDVALSTTIPALSGQPVISSATFANGVSSITWFWSGGVGNTGGYQLFSASGGAVSPVLSSTTFSYTQTGLTTNTSYQNYVTAYAVPASTNSTPYARYTLAAQTSGLTAITQNNEFEALTWSPNTNPAYTNYNVLWWTSVTSTVTFSTGTNAATAGVLPAGGTVYFTVQALNGEGIPAAYDATLFTGPPFTYFAVGVTTVAPNFSGTLTFAIPTGAIYLTISSGTFASQTSLSVMTPAVVPGYGPRLAPVAGLPSLMPGNQAGINFQITALDPFGTPQQPRFPIAVRIDPVPAAVAGANAATLSLARYDTAFNQWVPLITQRSAGELASLTEHLTQFAVLAVASPTDLSQITVGPNPLRPDANPGTPFTFRNLPQNTRVRVFTYVGEKLADLTADASGLLTWDGRNARGSLVASGVYIAVIEGAGAKKTMRLAVER